MRFWLLCMSLPQNRCALLGDMHWKDAAFGRQCNAAKPLVWPARHTADTDCAWKREFIETLRRNFHFQRIGNRPMRICRKLEPEMTSVKAALLSFAMLASIVMCGVGIYAADATNDHNAVDGYGVTAALR